MAEIDIERRPPRLWPWIAGVIAIVLAVWLALALLRPGPTSTPAPAAAPSADGA